MQLYMSRSNAKLRQLHNKPDMKNVIECQRLRWLEYVRRQPKYKLIHLVWDKAPAGRRSLGRLRLRWRDNIASDLRLMGIENKLEIMIDRDR